jgi:hypothetical protein
MIPEMERRLATFVDRASEMTRFREMLDTGDKPIMVVWGEPGLGKTSLFFRMIHECAERQLRKAELVWTDTRNHDYLAVMCKLRDDIGLECFQPFSQLVNASPAAQYEIKIDMGGGGGSVAEDMKIEGSARVGDVAYGIIKDSTFVLPMTDRAALENTRLIHLTDEFIRGLRQALNAGPLVVFFDGIEKMSDDTRKWVWGELLRAVGEGTLEKITFVLCGREKPQLDQQMEFIVEEAQLQPLGESDILEYLTKRYQDEKIVADEASLSMTASILMESTKGKPDVVANAVEGAIRKYRKRTGGR